MLKEQIKYGNSTIEYSLAFAERKTLGIKVYPDKSVHVIAPTGTSMDKVTEKVHSKAAWVLRQQDFFLSFHPITPPRKFISGETHLYLGKQYRLKLAEAEKDSVKLHGGNISVYCKDKEDKQRIEKLLKAWFKSKADLHFNNLFQELSPIAKELSDITPTLKYRWMDKRWGSCSQKGEILLNIELIKAPKKCIEYVIIHELCHMVHLNHSTAFYELLDKLSPGWRKTKDELEKLMV
ncbi:M48 family metallopeptidase [Plebeiibacterium sediminum]|uniref:M48 family metallopeptidase n=1 Tax=Plebeiibacterium sediminum TaxID=2992112 RepID=A0AAE3M1N9_9BACT|nr:SprT family zinc-dependent metalloprotease [Plebeiobacterium sediminum]MCW3785498.1 M48 family metallopeptidase [Plebeiobacterium sediminum]